MFVAVSIVDIIDTEHVYQGLGDTGQGMRVAANKLSLHPLLGHVKIILPSA